jgi:hypothetical protein
MGKYLGNKIKTNINIWLKVETYQIFKIDIIIYTLKISIVTEEKFEEKHTEAVIRRRTNNTMTERKRKNTI